MNLVHAGDHSGTVHTDRLGMNLVHAGDHSGTVHTVTDWGLTWSMLVTTQERSAAKP